MIFQKMRKISIPKTSLMEVKRRGSLKFKKSLLMRMKISLQKSLLMCVKTHLMMGKGEVAETLPGNTLEHAKVGTEGGKELFLQVPTYVGEEVPVVKEMVDEARSDADKWEIKNCCQDLLSENLGPF